MPLLVENWTLKLAAMIAGMEFLCIALLAGFWLPACIGRWAFRCVGGGGFAAYAAYLIYEFFFSDRLSGWLRVAARLHPETHYSGL